MWPPIEFKPIGPHHGYMGIGLITFGLLMMPHELYGIWDLVFIGIGSYFIVDDIIEHVFWGNTPLRLIFEKVIVPMLRKWKK